MREIRVDLIEETVRELCLESNLVLRQDVLKAVRKAASRESGQTAKNTFKSIIENAKIAKSKRLAICQDTGMVEVFLEIGQSVEIAGGYLGDAVNEGVRDAYDKGYFRKSIVEDPLIRNNTRTNTPCVIHTEIVGGDRLKISLSPKGFGSENKSSIRMFNPTDSIEDIKDFILDVVRRAGPDACPPFILGIGMGGTFEKAAVLSKKALFRHIDKRNPKRHIARLERELFKDINSLGIGPMGLGGKTTVLGVNILEFPTHIAGLPVAVNVSCHATRSAERIL